MLAIARDSWVGAYEAFRRMPTVFGSALVFFLILQFAEASLSAAFGGGVPGLGSSSSNPAQLMVLMGVGLALLIPRAFVQAPLAIAVHRWMLAEVAQDGLAIARTSRGWRFVGWIILTEAVIQVPNFLQFLFVDLRNAIAFGVLNLLAAVIGLVVLFRLALVFPAVALDRPDPARQSWAASRSHVWRIIGAMFVTGLPIGIVVGALSFIASKTLPMPISLAVMSVGQVAAIAVLAAVASCLYRQYGGWTAPSGLKPHVF